MGSRSYSGANAARGLGWLLRAQHNTLVREELPARWVELINCIDDKERQRLKAALTAAAAGGESPLGLRGIPLEGREGDER
jgi:hypothetical protein